MAGEMLLINPRTRRKSAKRSSARRKNPVAAKRRKSPISRLRTHVLGAAKRVTRRRRNPISLGINKADFMVGIKQAMIGAGGAVAVDAVMGQLNPHLPASMQINDTSVGVGDAVKAALTVILGKVLSKSTRGMSQKMAIGALTVQAHGIISTYLPSSMKLAYASPARVIPGTSRVGPIRQGINEYLPRGTASPALNRYMPTGTNSQILGRSQMSPREREGFSIY